MKLNLMQKFFSRQPFSLCQRHLPPLASVGARSFHVQARMTTMSMNLMPLMQRQFFTMMQSNRYTVCQQATPSFMSLNAPQAMGFSLKMRKVREKQQAQKGKYKLKTKKAFQKRFQVCGALRNKMFKFHKIGYRHLNRNKTKRNLKTKRGDYFLTNKCDIKRAKKLMPYFRRRKFLKM